MIVSYYFLFVSFFIFCSYPSLLECFLYSKSPGTSGFYRVNFYSSLLTTDKERSLLTNQQWLSIQKILKHPESPLWMKEKIRQLLFYKYERLAIFKAKEFKKFHFYKCRDLSIDELSLYSKMGLFKAIQNYQSGYDFYRYVNIYIQGELYKGLTDLFPICAIAKKDRIRKKVGLTLSKEERRMLWMKRNLYKKLLNTKFIGKEDWLFDKNNGCNEKSNLQNRIHKEEYEEKWRLLQESSKITPFQKRVFRLTFDFYLNKDRSNREVAELMGCSEEWIRKSIGSVITILTTCQ